MKKIPLTQNKYALVDDEDYEYLNKHKWYFNQGYAKRRLKNGVAHMHRVIMKTPDDMFTDHVNHNTLDNQKHNLRIVTKQQNNMNRKQILRTKTGYKGVYLSRNGKYRYYSAQISVDGIKRTIGNYKTRIEAALAYNKAAKELQGQYAYLNSI